MPIQTPGFALFPMPPTPPAKLSRHKQGTPEPLPAIDYLPQIATGSLGWDCRKSEIGLIPQPLSIRRGNRATESLSPRTPPRARTTRELCSGGEIEPFGYYRQPALASDTSSQHSSSGSWTTTTTSVQHSWNSSVSHSTVLTDDVHAFIPSHRSSPTRSCRGSQWFGNDGSLNGRKLSTFLSRALDPSFEVPCIRDDLYPSTGPVTEDDAEGVEDGVEEGVDVGVDRGGEPDCPSCGLQQYRRECPPEPHPLCEPWCRMAPRCQMGCALRRREQSAVGTTDSSDGSSIKRPHILGCRCPPQSILCQGHSSHEFQRFRRQAEHRVNPSVSSTVCYIGVPRARFRTELTDIDELGTPLTNPGLVYDSDSSDPDWSQPPSPDHGTPTPLAPGQGPPPHRPAVHHRPAVPSFSLPFSAKNKPQAKAVPHKPRTPTSQIFDTKQELLTETTTSPTVPSLSTISTFAFDFTTGDEFGEGYEGYDGDVSEIRVYEPMKKVKPVLVDCKARPPNAPKNRQMERWRAQPPVQYRY